MQSIRVEFYGVARTAAGCDSFEVPLPGADAIRLGDLLQRIAALAPELAQTCLEGECFATNFIGNVNGDQFVRDPNASLTAGQTLLILSADAGG